MLIRSWAVASCSAEFQTVATIYLLGHSSKALLPPFVTESSRLSLSLEAVSQDQLQAAIISLEEGLGRSDFFKVYF